MKEITDELIAINIANNLSFSSVVAEIDIDETEDEVLSVIDENQIEEEEKESHILRERHSD